MKISKFKAAYFGNIIHFVRSELVMSISETGARKSDKSRLSLIRPPEIDITSQNAIFLMK
ncbi:MAG: hypothetical protein MHPSP_000049 [Paramarteilia canceri]